MPELTKSEAKLLRECVETFKKSFEANVADVIAEHFHGACPTEVKDCLEALHLLVRQLEAESKTVAVHDAHNRLLRAVLIEERRRTAEEVEEPLRKATDPELVRHLQRGLRRLEALMESPWFAGVTGERLPRLTDYVSVRYAEEVVPSMRRLAPREYDEKFNILEAPQLFLPDLAYYRQHCSLRGLSLAVGFADIDDFKVFNTEYGETRIDRDVLTPLMQTLEAHFFARGHVYRFGGDEYVLLVPNADEAGARGILGALQERLTQLRFRGIERKLTISIGLCMVSDQAFLTDREVLEAANRAKSHAKQNRKDSLFVCRGPLYRNEDIEPL